MDKDDDLLNSFSYLGNELVAERENLSSGGTSNLDISFHLLAMILKHYHETYCRKTGYQSQLENVLGRYPGATSALSLPIETIHEWVLDRCDREVEPVPYRVLHALQGEYLTILWRVLEQLKIVTVQSQGDDEKIRSTLIALGFSEPYHPRWGFNYVCHELESARDALSSLNTLNTASIDAPSIEVIMYNTLLVFKAYKRFLHMLLSFYGQYAFGDMQQLVARLKPEKAKSRGYLASCPLQELIWLVVELEKYAKEQSSNNFWKDFHDAILLERQPISELQKLCDNVVTQLRLGPTHPYRSAYTVEEILTLRQGVLDNLIRHLLVVCNEYRNALPTVIALKVRREAEHGGVHMDYVDESGELGFFRADLRFQPGKDFYLLPRPGKPPIILPVDARHQGFILKRNFNLKDQMDDVDLHKLFAKLERSQSALVKSGPQQVTSLPLTSLASPLAILGINQDGEVLNEGLLVEAIRSALRNGETDMIEFKAGPSDDHEIARELAALANTKGGILVFGLPDDPKPGSLAWQQADTGRTKLARRNFRNEFLVRIERVAKGFSPPYCSPPVKYTPHIKYIEDVNGEVIIVAVVPFKECKDLCAVTGSGIWVRLWGSSVKAKAEWLNVFYKEGKKLWVQ